MNLHLYRNPKLMDMVVICQNLEDDQREQIEAFTGQPYDFERTAMNFIAGGGPAWVLCEDERPIGAAGFTMIRPGVWQDWMATTARCWAPEVWKTTTKHVKRVMDAMLKTEAHRLQCVSLASRIHAHKWYRVIGLELEGTLHAYGANGEDALMFYRLRKGE